MWNVCIVGLGYWSDVHFRGWQSVPGVNISAIVDLDSAKLKAKADMYGYRPEQLFTDLEEAMNLVDIDVIDIVTRPDSHLELVSKAAMRGKHVLCQKPFAPTLAECEEMVRICEEAGVTLMIAEGWRWHSHYRKLKEIADSGALGAINFAKIVAKWFFTPTFGDPAKMTQPYFRGMERLMLYEMAPHWIDAYRYLFGDPKAMNAFYTRVSPHIIGDDLAVLLFHHEGMTGMLEAGWASREFAGSSFEQPAGENLMEYVWIEGSEAGLRLTADGVMELIDADRTVRRIEYEPHNLQLSHNRLHRHMIEALSESREPETSGRRYLNVMRIIETAYESGRRSDPIG
ncbi:Gfo/Idh/MocA family protein [Paenibacillus montanisoli]|uniref:Gfo/Idh/MocA family protein n=1 Tax=Paenibacillus montanisoli TaxID=2081970 RepID=UPI001402562D|nr:Gfo/Idh/MocA family oxidoreductase [Paenibacillus montanisoli]